MSSLLEVVLSGGFFMIPLAFCSVVSLTVIIERFSALSDTRVLNESLVEALDQGPGDLGRVVRIAQTEQGTLARLTRLAVSQKWQHRDEAVETLRSAARREATRLERGLVVLEIVAGLAPLLGLLGTVSGLVRIFGNIGPDGLGEQGMEVARGISEALTTTVAGLVIAIPSLICWNLLSRKIDVLVAELEHYLQVVLRLLGDEQAKGRLP